MGLLRKHSRQGNVGSPETYTGLSESSEFSVSDPDPDPYWIRIQSDHWIRIRIRNLNTDPDPGGQK